MSCRNYLEVEPKPSALFSMVEDAEFKDFDLDESSANFKSITPKPGFCVKTKTDNNEKMFINVCHTGEVPPPPGTLDVYKIMAGENPEEESLFRFPLSLGDLHIELDKSGNECKCYDVVINSDYYRKVSEDPALRDFLMTLACSGLERKFDISIDVGTCVVLNKPYHGRMPTHFIKVTHENMSPTEKIAPENDLVMPVKDASRLVVLPSPEILQYNLFITPASGCPSLLIFQGITTAVPNRKSMSVFVSKNKLTVRQSKLKALISIRLPYAVIAEKSLSNFWRNRLTVAMPIL